MDKDTHTWRWWPRRVVTRLLQPADTGQEEVEEMGEQVEEKEEEEIRNEKKMCGKKGRSEGASVAPMTQGVWLGFQAFAYSASLLPI